MGVGVGLSPIYDGLGRVELALRKEAAKVERAREKVAKEKADAAVAKFCPLCGFRCGTTRGKLLLVQDHDHKTGQLRGRICSKCNRGLAVFREDSDLLDRAAAYLRRYGR